MTGAKIVLVEFGSQRWRVTPEASVLEGDVTLAGGIRKAHEINPFAQEFEKMDIVADRLQVSTGRNLLHELFYLFGKMDVIQALIRGGATMYDPQLTSLIKFGTIRMAISSSCPFRYYSRNARCLNSSYGSTSDFHCN
jgi:hypothetical protein